MLVSDLHTHCLTLSDIARVVKKLEGSSFYQIHTRRLNLKFRVHGREPWGRAGPFLLRSQADPRVSGPDRLQLQSAAIGPGRSVRSATTFRK